MLTIARRTRRCDCVSLKHPNLPNPYTIFHLSAPVLEIYAAFCPLPLAPSWIQCPLVRGETRYRWKLLLYTSLSLPADSIIQKDNSVPLNHSRRLCLTHSQQSRSKGIRRHSIFGHDRNRFPAVRQRLLCKRIDDVRKDCIPCRDKVSVIPDVAIAKLSKTTRVGGLPPANGTWFSLCLPAKAVRSYFFRKNVIHLLSLLKNPYNSDF